MKTRAVCGLLLGLGLALVLVLPKAARAHEVRLESTQQAAAVLRLVYGDGQPFAFEAYELYRPGRDAPEQVGRTNAQGQVVFLPGAQAEWRLKAYSSDGHGVDQVLTVAAGAAGTAGTAPATNNVPRVLLWLAGLGVVFGIFGVMQLFLRSKKA